MTAPWITASSSTLPNTSDYLATTGLHLMNKTCGNNDGFKFLAYTVTYCLVFPLGLLSNLIALFVFFCLTPKKSPNTVFTTNLALSDVGFSLTLPFRLVYYLRDGHWAFSDWLCRWCVFSFYVNLYTSVLFLTGLSVLRYIAVLYPLWNKTLVTVRRATWVCLGIWLFVLASSTPFLFNGTRERHGKTRCFEPHGMGSWWRLLAMNYVALTFGFLLPFLTILVCYTRIIHNLVLSSQTLKHHVAARRRSVPLMAVVLATFLVCFLPYHVSRTAHLHAVVSTTPGMLHSCLLTERLQKILVVTLCLAASNSCFNPLLYYFAGETFRRTIRNSTRSRSRSSFSSYVQGSLLQHRANCDLTAMACPDKSPQSPCMLTQDNDLILNRAEDL